MPALKPTHLSVAAQNAEQRVRTAVEQVKAAEKKARVAKEKAWRVKLLFKLARRASKKAKKAARRARAKAVRAEIALKELIDQMAPLKRPVARSRSYAPTPRLSTPIHKYGDVRGQGFFGQTRRERRAYPAVDL